MATQEERLRGLLQEWCEAFEKKCVPYNDSIPREEVAFYNRVKQALSAAPRQEERLRERRNKNEQIRKQFAPLRIRLLSRACDANDCESCRNPKCECDCHDNER